MTPAAAVTHPQRQSWGSECIEAAPEGQQWTIVVLDETEVLTSLRARLHGRSGLADWAKHAVQPAEQQP